jgi:DNA-directed RNA polymerase subunit RPC12/RpoP
MKVNEKVSYIKGLFDGMEIDKDKKENKILAAIIDVLEDIALDLEDLENNAMDLADEIDAISSDLEDVENIVYDEDDEDDCECNCGHHHHDDEDDEDEYMYSVVCPSCGEELEIDESVLDLDSIQCPACGETLEFEFDEDDEEEDEEGKGDEE